MGLPAKRRSSSQKGRRRSHLALRPTLLIACSHCKRNILPHRVCPHCGFYRGRAVIEHKSILDRKKHKDQGRASKEKSEKAKA